MITAKKSPLKSSILLLAALVAIGLGVGIVRLIAGLGATTNLSDGYPWGLWIVYDVFFIPFSAGAFMISAITHIYGRKEYHSIARPVILAGFLGYVFVVVVLLMDLGRWHKFYNILVPWYWNLHSFMFEVSMCVTLYTGVLIIEVAPVILERLNWQKPLRAVRALAVLIAGAGIVLSSLHQSSLGSLFLLMPYKLHALWWTPLLPLLFFTSAAFSGLAMAILVAVISFRAFRRHLEIGLLTDLAKIVSVMLGIYLVLKVGDLLLAGEIELILSEGGLSLLFLAEMVIGVIVPMILFGRHKVRESDAGLISGAVCVLVGLALNRASVAFIALSAPAGATYFPHWMEFVIAGAAIAAAVLLFALAVRFLPTLPYGDQRKPSIIPSKWPRWMVIPIGLGLPLLTIAVVLLLEPRVHAVVPQVESASKPETYAMSQSENCQKCHFDQVALAQAGAGQDALARLIIEPEPPQTPHGRLNCVTCHQGSGGTDDVNAAHIGVIVDPSEDYSEGCLSCHRDLPDEFPQDRLRTPHSEVVHGQMVNVYCSDCHGAVGHGFDPVSGEVICPMGVCLDCHRTRQLDSKLTDCGACHINMDCGAVCHVMQPYVDSLQDANLSAYTHAQEGLVCLDCHEQAVVEQVHEEAVAGTPIKARKFEMEFCFDCHVPNEHTSYEEVIERTKDYTIDEQKINPHDPHEVFEETGQGQFECYGCHKMHKESPGINYCYSCHHSGTLENCNVCHEE